MPGKWRRRGAASGWNCRSRRAATRVYLFIDWCRSPTVTVHAQPGEVIQLFCEPAGTAREGLQAVNRNTDAYIKLVRS